MDKYIYDEINNKLKNILVNRLNLDISTFSQEDFEKNLLSTDLGLEPRDLIYLFFDIEEEFGISIPQIDVAEGRFKSYKSISNVIFNILSKKIS